MNHVVFSKQAAIGAAFRTITISAGKIAILGCLMFRVVTQCWTADSWAGHEEGSLWRLAHWRCGGAAVGALSLPITYNLLIYRESWGVVCLPSVNWHPLDQIMRAAWISPNIEAQYALAASFGEATNVLATQKHIESHAECIFGL